MKKTKKINIRALCVTAIMSAFGAVLMMLEIPIPLMPPFIKLDFSELPALITTYALGPAYGVLVCLIKNILHFPFGSSAGVGEISNFLLGAVFVGTAGLIYKYRHNRKWALIASVTGAFLMAAVCVPLNYFVIYPLFVKILGLSNEIIVGMYRDILPGFVKEGQDVKTSLFRALLIFNVPFTFVKGIIDSAFCFILYKPLSPLLKGKNKAKQDTASDGTDFEIK